MAWTSGFFNSVNGDRVYNAQQMSGIFEGLITDGVYETVGNKMAVETNNGLTIQIATGRGWFAKHWVNNDSEYTMTLDASDVILNRYVAVVIKADDTDGVRDALPYLKYGEFATDPVKPVMERTEKVKEFCLAYILQNAGATEIRAEHIEDTRSNNDLCGWVTGLIKQVTTTTLYAQWEALFNGFLTESTETFNDWFTNLEGKINDNTETMLVSALPTSMVLKIPVDSWQGNTATVSVVGMTDTKTVFCSPADATKEIYVTAGVKLTGQATDNLTFTADSVPTGEVSVNIVHMGV